MSNTADYIITQISSSNIEFDKASGIGQIPIVLTIPGPLSLRDKSSPYTVLVDKK